MTALWIGLGVFGVVALAFLSATIRDASLRRSGLLPPAGQATIEDVKRLVQAGERIAAIRVYREVYHVSLVEAKKAIDDLQVSAQ